MIKKFISFVLIFSLLATAAIRPVYATGAEGVILGGLAGAPALSGVALTAPQIALLVAAGFGLIYAVDHAEEIADGLQNAMETAAAGVANGAQKLAEWWEQATAGKIALASAPAWLLSAIRGWVAEQYSAPAALPSGFVSYETNVKQVVALDWWASADRFIRFAPNADVMRAVWWEYTDDGLFSYQVRIFFSGTLQEDGTRAYVQYRQPWSSSWSGGSSHYMTLTEAGSIDLSDNLTEYQQQTIAALTALTPVDRNDTCCSDHTGTWLKQTQQYAECALNNKKYVVDIPSSGSICPDATVGGIGNVLEDGHDISAVTVPDMAIAGSNSICPDSVKDGSVPIGDTVADVIVGLTDGTVSWSDYVADVGVGTPSVAIPGEGTGVLDYPITDTGVSDVPLDGTETMPGEGTETDAPAGLSPYLLQLRDFFPFCIPFDIASFFEILCAEPEAPCFDWEFPNGTGGTESLTIDLSVFDPVAQLLRNMELLLFCVGLAFATRNLIRG